MYNTLVRLHTKRSYFCPRTYNHSSDYRLHNKDTYIILIDTKEYYFQTSTEFSLWKETIEEETHAYYTKEKEYKPNQQMVEIHITQYHRYKYYYAKCRRSEY